MEKVCATCVNRSVNGCKIMLATPKELFCWADNQTQIKREYDIMHYAQKYSVMHPEKGITNIISTAKMNIRRLQKA